MTADCYPHGQFGPSVVQTNVVYATPTKDHLTARMHTLYYLLCKSHTINKLTQGKGFS